MQECGRKIFNESKMHYIGPGSAMELYDLIQEFEISLYFSTVLLKYLTVIIGLFTVLVMIVRCYMWGGKGYSRATFLPLSYFPFTVLIANYFPFTVLGAFPVHRSQ